MTGIESILQVLHAPLLRSFAAHWFDRRGGRLVTLRRDFDIFSFPALLPHVFLYDYDPAARDLTLRLAGEEIRRILPNSRPGTPLARIMPPDYLVPVQDRYRRVCEEPAIMVASGRVFLRLGGAGIGERLLMPLADDNGRVHQMIGATLYQIGEQTIEDRLFAREDVTATFFPLRLQSEAE